MGEEFEEQYEEKTERRRQAQRKVDQETLIKICYEAIKGGGFDGEEPRFTFEGPEVEHDVVLMESPREDLSKFKHTFEDSGNISFGMFHMGDLWSCIFNQETKPLVDKIETESYYLVVGRYQENVKNKGTDEEEVYKNISPVRGILPLPKAKEFAEKYEQQMDAASIEEQSEAQSGSSDDSDIDVGASDDTGVDRDRVVKIFETIGKKKREILEGTASGDEDSMDKLVSITNNNLSQEADRETILDIFEEEVQEIEGRDEEEEDDFDLDMGDGEEEDSDDFDMGSSSDKSEDTTETESSDDEGSDPSDWF